MFKSQRPVWPAIGTIVLTLLINVIIVGAAYVDDRNYSWLLLVSIPLLLTAIYGASKNHHLLQKYFIELIQSPSQDHSKSSRSIYPKKISPADFNVQIGNDQCPQPYNASVFNVGSMEAFKSESVSHQLQGDKEDKYCEYLVDEALSAYYLAAGGIVWQIGYDYVRCRTENGHFNSSAFKKIACRAEVKMIELKIIEPNKGKIDNNIFSNPAFTTFRNAEGMIYFLTNLRELSEGKPIGIRLCINNKKEFYQICHAVRKAQLVPDFIGITENSFERTGPIHLKYPSPNGIPMYDALLFASQTLHMYGLRNKMKIIADSKIISSFDILKVFALGADVVHFNSRNAYDFRIRLMKDTIQLMNDCGFETPSDITLSNFLNRVDVLHSKDSVKLNGYVFREQAVMHNSYHFAPTTSFTKKPFAGKADCLY
jgi:hypothetical protein